MSRVLLFLLVLSTAFDSRAAGVDPSFNAHVETTRFLSKSVNKLIICPDGKIVAFGVFNSYNGQPVGGLIRLNPDATLDTTFNNYGFGASVVPDNVQLLPDGKVLMSGSFSLANGTAYTGKLVRLNNDGTIDNSFASQTTGPVSHFKVDGAGRILVSGDLHFLQGGNDVAVNVARLLANGDVDVSFAAQGFAGTVVNLQGNRLVYTVYDNALQQNRIFRLKEDGSPDDTFTPTLIGGWSIYDTKEQADHKLVVLQANRLIRLNENGGMDPSFTIPPVFTWQANMLYVGSDGRITYAAEYFSPSYTRVSRLLTDGSPDPTFTPYNYVVSGGSSSTAIVVMNDGGVLIGDASSSNQFMRLGPNGSRDSSFNPGGAGFQTLGSAWIRAIKATPDGKILIGGNFDRINGNARPKITRLNGDSSIDTTFQINTTATGNYFSSLSDIYHFTIQTDGKILISGNFTYFVGGVQKTSVVRLLSNGSIDPTFVPSLVLNDFWVVNHTASNKPVQRPDLRILVGTARTSNVDTMSAPLQLSAGGVRDNSFAPDLFTSKSSIAVFDLAVMPDGKVMASGMYDIPNINSSIRRGFIARLNADGTTDSSFQLFEMDNLTVPMFSLLPNGQIIFVMRSPTQSYVSRLMANGSVDPTFTAASSAIGTINDIAALPSGKIVVVGSFATYNQSPRVNLAQLNADGSLDNDIGSANGEVFCVTVDNHGGILVGGQFTTINVGGQPTMIPSLVRLTESTSIRRPIFDFDGDGKTDEVVFRPANNVWYLNRSQAGFTAYQFGAAGDVLTPADFTGDGKTDVAVFRPSTGEWYVLRSEDNTFFVGHFGSDGDIPVPGDFDGDGKADLAVYRPSEGVWYLQGSTAGFSAVRFGTSEDKPTLGDFDGDGKTDIAVYRPSTGVWYRLNSSNGSFYAVQFGLPDDKVVPADYTGDGKTDIAVWRPSDGTWYILRSEDNSFYGQKFGMSGDLPAPGDYDGDGKADTAIFRPGEGNWYELRSTSGFTVTHFGSSGDKPTPNAFVY